MLHTSFTPFPVLTTKRLMLRQLSINDNQPIFVLRSDAEINKFLNRKMAVTLDDASQFIQAVNDNVAKNLAIYWAITCSGKNELAGTICLFCFSDEQDSCEIGYELLKSFQGQGIMQEAAEIVIDYAFSTSGVKKIDACFHSDNERSIKLLEKFYFIHSDEPDTDNPDLVRYYLKRQ